MQLEKITENIDTFNLKIARQREFDTRKKAELRDIEWLGGKTLQYKIDGLFGRYGSFWRDVLQEGTENVVLNKEVWSEEAQAFGSLVYELDANYIDEEGWPDWSSPLESRLFIVVPSAEGPDVRFEQGSETFWRINDLEKRCPRGSRVSETLPSETQHYLGVHLPAARDTLRTVLKAACDDSLNPRLAAEARYFREGLSRAA